MRISHFHRVGAQTVRMQIPDGRRVIRVELLRAGRALPFHDSGEWVSFTIPQVLDYEVAGLYAI